MFIGRSDQEIDEELYKAVSMTYDSLLCIGGELEGGQRVGDIIHSKRPPERVGRGIAALSVWLMLALVASAALAQPTTVRLDIRKAEVVEQKYHLYFTFLDGNREAIKDLTIENLSVLSADRQKKVSIGQEEVMPLIKTRHAVAVMFVVANYKAFNEGNANTFSAVREVLSEMEPRTESVADLGGVVYYGNSFRDVPFTYKISELKDQVLKIKESKDTIPRMFAALGNAIRRFEKEVATQKVDQRYIVLLTDGHGTWEGSSNPQAIDNKIKQVATSLKESQITLLTVGYSPTLGDQDPSLTMLQQLSNQSGGTLRIASDQDQVFPLMTNTYNEIYNSHVLTFRSNTLKPGQNHKLRLNVDYKNLKAKSPPQTIYVPTPEGLPRSYLISGGVGCVVLSLLGVILLLAFMMWRKKKKEKALAESEFDDMATDEPNYGGQPVMQVGVGAPGMALPSVLEGRPEYSDEPPAEYLCRLKTVGGPIHGRVFFLVEENTHIGSSDENELMLLDGTVSKRHAGIRVQDGNRFELHDFGSTNGVFINGKRISKQFLKEGDRIVVGETEFAFHVQ